MIPAMAAAEMWRWRGASGQVHYSNVPGRAPARASTVRREVGFLAPAIPTPDADAAAPSAGLEQLRQERALKRRLGEIEAFYACVRAQQLARLQAYANSTLLPDWIVADRWLQLKHEEGRLRAELGQLERRRCLARSVPHLGAAK